VDESLQERLRKLGVVKGLAGLKPHPVPPARSDPGPRAQSPSPNSVLPGEEVAHERGTFWLARYRYPASLLHGRHAVGSLTQVPARSLALMGVPELGARPAFLDTETTGLAGGTGTLAFLIGAGLWDGEELVLHLIFMRRPDEEPAALSYLTELLSEATGLVTFNGRGFDVPILETRYIMNRMSPQPLALPHLDLLTVARQLWRDHLASRALGELERHILRVARTGQDIDSGLIPWLYREYLESGDTTDMIRIFYHNEIDVLSLASLLVHVAEMIDAPEEMDLAPAEWAGIGRVYDKAGREEEALAAWRRALSGEAGELDETCASRLWEELGMRCRRRGAWDEALGIWHAWSAGVPSAVTPLVEEAKYYEWSSHDLRAALVCTEQALRRAERWPSGMKRYKVLSELRHRYERLVRRLAQGESDSESEDRYG
jgi:uncharacterized protein